MNLNEGTRRLALLLGAAGGIFGGFVGYMQLQSTVRQRAEHQRFEQAAIRIEQLGKKTQEAYSVYRDIDPATLGWKVLAKYPQFWPWVSGHALKEPDLPGGAVMPTPKSFVPDTPSSFVPDQPEPWEDANYDWRTLGIKTPDGHTLYPTPAPGAWSYLLVALLPLLGFFIPWGAVRAIGWVGAGFIASGM